MEWLNKYATGETHTCYFSSSLGAQMPVVVWQLPSITRGVVAMGVGFPIACFGLISSLIILFYVRKRTFELYF